MNGPLSGEAAASGEGIVGSLWSQGPSFPVNSCERKLLSVPETFHFSWFSRHAFDCWRSSLHSLSPFIEGSLCPVH